LFWHHELHPLEKEMNMKFHVMAGLSTLDCQV
jgi:hypothetical protein